jgi:hypothetical protein
MCFGLLSVSYIVHSVASNFWHRIDFFLYPSAIYNAYMVVGQKHDRGCNL